MLALYEEMVTKSPPPAAAEKREKREVKNEANAVPTPTVLECPEVLEDSFGNSGGFCESEADVDLGEHCPHVRRNEIVLGEQVGKGAFARVYKGRCRNLDVAVKIPLKSTKSDAETTRREIEIISRIQHPHLCLFMGACTDEEENMLIVTELLECTVEEALADVPCPFPSLAGRVAHSGRRRKFSPQRSQGSVRRVVGGDLGQRVEWASQAASAVEWLHKNDPPVFHRDLKPGNFLLDRHGIVKVTDFGLSVLWNANGRADSANVGTPVYFSPEHMATDTTAPHDSKVLEKMDVFSFAISLWEMATCLSFGSMISRDHGNFAGFKKAMLAPADGAAPYRPPVPVEMPDCLKDLLTECWNSDPEARPAFSDIVTRLRNMQAACTQWERNREINMHQWKHLDTVWVPTFGDARSVVPWAEFKKAFQDANELSNAQMRSRAIRYLQVLFAADGSRGRARTVSIKRWGQLLGWFGPLDAGPDGCGFLERLSSAMECEYFHHDMPSSFADEMLVGNRTVGAFLLRFSGRSFGHFCLSSVTPDRKVVHQLIPFNTASRTLHIRGGVFTSLNDVIARGTVQLGLMYGIRRRSDVDALVDSDEEWSEDYQNDLVGYLAADSVEELLESFSPDA